MVVKVGRDELDVRAIWLGMLARRYGEEPVAVAARRFTVLKTLVTSAEEFSDRCREFVAIVYATLWDPFRKYFDGEELPYRDSPDRFMWRGLQNEGNALARKYPAPMFGAAKPRSMVRSGS